VNDIDIAEMTIDTIIDWYTFTQVVKEDALANHKAKAIEGKVSH